MFFDDFSAFRKELQDAAKVDIIAFNASITAMARSSQWPHALTLSLHLRCHGNLNGAPFSKVLPSPDIRVYIQRPYLRENLD